MKKNKNRGIMLIALVITIIILLILGSVVIINLNKGNIIENSLSVAEQAKVESMKEEISLIITNKMIKENRKITIEQIIEELEK